MSISGYALSKAAIFDRKQNDSTLMTMGKFVTSRAVYPVIVLTGLVEALPSALLSLTLRLPFYLFSSHRFSSLTNHTFDALQSAKDAFIKIFTFYLAKAAKAPAVVEAPVEHLQLAPAAEPKNSTPLPLKEAPPIERSYLRSSIDIVKNNSKILLIFSGLAATAFALYYFDFAPKLTNTVEASPLPEQHPTTPFKLPRLPLLITDGSEKIALQQSIHMAPTEPVTFDNRTITVMTSELFNLPTYEETSSPNEGLSVIDVVTTVGQGLLAVPILLFGTLSLIND